MDKKNLTKDIRKGKTATRKIKGSKCRRKAGGKGGSRGNLGTSQQKRVNMFNAGYVPVADLLKRSDTPLDFVLPCFIRGTFGLLTGAGGTGKSFFALQNAISVALGRDLFDFWEPGFEMKMGSVMYISAEDGEDIIAERLRGLKDFLKPEEVTTVENNLKFFFLNEFSIVKKSGGRFVASHCIEDLQQHLKKMKQKPRLIIIDTLNRSLGGACENNASSMGALLEVIKGIAQASTAAVLLVHHTAKRMSTNLETALSASAARGSSALTDNCRFQINMFAMQPVREADERGEPPEENVLFAISKANYGKKPPIRFLLRGKNGVLFGSIEAAKRMGVMLTTEHKSPDNQNRSPRAEVMPKNSQRR